VHPTFSGRLRTAITNLLPQARGLDVASDFDGTLVPIVAHPRQTVLAERMRQALVTLAGLRDVNVAVMSGRSLDDLERHADLPGVHFVGLAGLESRDLSGRRHVHGKGRIDPALIDELRAWCQRYSGAWIEDKVLAFSIHYRAVAAASRPDFVHGLSRCLAPHGSALEVTQGLMVVELRPAGSPNKAAALDRWLGSWAPGRLLIYLGDDANDIPALARTGELGGVAVAVGPRHLEAPEHLAGPQATMEFLEWLTDLWRTRLLAGSGGPPTGTAAAAASVTNGRSTPSPDSPPRPESIRSTPGALGKARKLRSDRPRSPSLRVR
jgi:trehalose-phosphatase